MLVELHIRNFALIDDLSIDFSSHLNVLTGETGAGKSILIDAVRFVMGERIDQVRSGTQEEQACVEAVFELSNRNSVLQEKLAPFCDAEDHQIIFRREQNGEGRTRSWINNRLVNQSTLREISRELIDIHGQYDHQLLFDPASHLEILDRYAKVETLKADYVSLYDDYAALVKKREDLKALEAGKEMEIDFLKFQIEEIENASLEEGEEETLRQDHMRLANCEKLSEHVSRLISLLDEEENSVSSNFAEAFRAMTALARLDESTEAFKSRFEDLQLGLNELVSDLRDYHQELSFDPDRLSEIENRLKLIGEIKRKYGPAFTQVLFFLNEAKEKYERLANTDFYEKKILKQLEEITPKLKQLSGQLRKKRAKAAEKMKEFVERELKDLAIKYAQFDCSFFETDFGKTGSDRIEFLISLNAGQNPLPLQKIISGGEASRVMLAMKRALMEVDPIETLIFDEIDTNIGGRLGTITGEKLKDISRERQVLLITHLPQIASFADKHFKVSKCVKQGKTRTQYAVITGEERVQELAQMMSGKQETEIAKRHAKEMLERVSP